MTRIGQTFVAAQCDFEVLLSDDMQTQVFTHGRYESFAPYLNRKYAKSNQLMKLKFSPMGATKVLPKIESLKRQPQIAAASVVAAAAAAVANNAVPSA